MATTTTATTVASKIPVSSLGTRSEFTSIFGNEVQGMYVTFKNEAASKTGDAATAKLAVGIDFHWYNNSVDTVNAAPGTTGKIFSWELQIYSPYETYYFGILKDGWAGDLKVSSPAAVLSQSDKITVKWVDDTDTSNATNKIFSLDDLAYKDTTVTEGVRDKDVDSNAAVAGVDGCVNDLVKKTPETTDMCTEKWEMIDSATKQVKLKCVRAKLDFERPFIVKSTPSQNACDVNLDYRKFVFSANWKWNAATSDPGQTSFNSQKLVVDFERFLKVPEEAYGFAFDALNTTLSGIAFAIWMQTM